MERRLAITRPVGVRFVSIRKIRPLGHTDLGDVARRIGGQSERILEEAEGGLPARSIPAGSRVVVDVEDGGGIRRR